MTSKAFAPVRSTAIAIFLAAGLAAGCASDSGADDPRATRVNVISLGAFGATGDGDLVAAWRDPLYESAGVRIFRQDAAEPDFVSEVGAFVPPSQHVQSVVVNAQSVTAAVANPYLAGSTSTVVFSRISAPSSAYTVDVPARVLAATVWNDRLVAAAASDVYLYDVSDAANPLLLQEFSSDAATGIAAVADGVYVFTESGYGYVDLAGGTWSAAASDDLRGVTKAVVHGTRLHVGGPSRFAGYYRLARVEATAPTLAVEAKNDRIVDHETAGDNIADFAYDAETDEYLVLAETSVYDQYDPSGGGTSTLGKFVVSGSDLVLAERVSLDHAARTTNTYPAGEVQRRLHCNRGRAFAVLVPGEDDLVMPIGFMFVYRLP